MCGVLLIVMFGFFERFFIIIVNDVRDEIEKFVKLIVIVYFFFDIEV